jgi:large subunit ribosomal protein L29
MSKRNDFVNGLKDLSETDLTTRIREDDQRLKKLEFAHAISPLESPVNIVYRRYRQARINKRKIGKATAPIGMDLPGSDRFTKYQVVLCQKIEI